ncbi:MAG: hypothetical protein WBP71_17445 [Terracidiphilus sp.]
MNDELLKAAKERFQDLSEAEERVLSATKSERAVCGSDDDSSNPTNDPKGGERWDKTRTIRADVIGWLCRNAAIYGRSASDGINVYGAKVEGILDLSYTDIPIPLWFDRCYFNNEVWLKNAKIPTLTLKGCWTKKILADGIQVANNVGLRDGFHSTGEVLFRDANVGAGFIAVDAIFECEPPKPFSAVSLNSLGCDRIKVNGSMFLRGSVFKGEVGLAGAYIGSNLECDGSAFNNPCCNQDGSRYAIRADRITVNGSVYLRHQFSSKGSVRLLNAKVGMLDCTQATIEGDGKNGFNAENATIAGHAVFDNFTIQDGGVEFRGLAAEDVSFRGAKLTTVDLRYAAIRRALQIKQIKEADQALWDLRNASVGSVDDDENGWPRPGRLFIDGFTYQGFGNVSVVRPGESSEAPLDFKLRRKWIELDTSRPHRPHPYRQLANAYLRMGDTLQSRKALYSLEELLHLRMIQESSSWRSVLHSIWRQLLKWTIGYGYKLWLSGVWLSLLLIAGVFLSHWSYFAHVTIPTDKDAYAFFAQHGYPPVGYPRFSVTMFSIENTFPAISFSMSDHWAATGCLRYWFMCQRIAGWFLSIFFIAGVSGLVKSDK